MKKFILGLGSVAATVAPVVAVVSCGSDDEDKGVSLFGSTAMVVLGNIKTTATPVDTPAAISDKSLTLTDDEKHALADQAAAKILTLDASDRSKIKGVSIRFAPSTGAGKEFSVHGTLAHDDAQNASTMDLTNWKRAIFDVLDDDAVSVDL